MKYFDYMQHTPIIKYCINSKVVDVKREDMFAMPPAPQLAKLRGVYKYIKNLKKQGYNTIAAYDTRVSHAGWGVACICKELGLKCILFYPKLKDKPTERQQLFCEFLVAKLKPLAGGRTRILYGQAKKYCDENNIHLLPLGLVCVETTMEVVKEAKRINKNYGTVVICSGTGTITSGVLLGLQNKFKKFIAISAGMNPEEQKERITKLWKEYEKRTDKKVDFNLLKKLEIIVSDTDYYTPEYGECPFPAHEYYDMKAWNWLMKNYEKLPKPILFWNIGA